MIYRDPHLTEEELQTFADGSMADDRARTLDAHLRICAACSADVGRLKAVITKVSEPTTPMTDTATEELWPSIRARIERSKVVPLSAAPRKRTFTARHFGAVAMLVAASAVTAVLLRPSHSVPVDSVATPATSSATIPGMTAVSDSVRSYEEEARTLLNRLELQRSMLRPEARVSLDRDLKAIDQAIDELKLAIANDPRNPALRRLLASSYRQKVDLLKRAANAG